MAKKTEDTCIHEWYWRQTAQWTDYILETTKGIPNNDEHESEEKDHPLIMAPTFGEEKQFWICCTQFSQKRKCHIQSKWDKNKALVEFL